MRITNTNRQLFIIQVMNDVPFIDYQEQAQQIAREAAEASILPEVKAILDNPITRDYVRTGYIHIPGPFSGIQVRGALLDFWLDEQTKARIKELELLHVEQFKKRSALVSHVSALIAGCSTFEQIRKLAPELSKYLPEKVDATKNLPAVANVITELVEAGWPKSEPS